MREDLIQVPRALGSGGLALGLCGIDVQVMLPPWLPGLLVVQMAQALVLVSE